MPPSSSPITFIQTEIYLFTACFAFLVVLVTTPLVKAIALHCGRVDLPSHRKVHSVPIPRVGGVAICLATTSALLFAYFFAYFCGGLANISTLPSTLPSGLWPSFWIVLVGSIGFFLIGFSDDLISLSPVARLLLQIAVASLVWLGGVRIGSVVWLNLGWLDLGWLDLGFANPFSELVAVQLGWLSLPLTVFWMVGVVNAFNWIDGLDGLAAGVGGIAAATSSLLCWYTGQLPAALISIALLGSLLGFLVFNFNPAQIFMGDGGSYFIGFLLASISVTGVVEGLVVEDLAVGSATIAAVLLPLLVLAIPLGDMTLVILARLRQGVSPFLADQRHLHHRLLQIGLPHRLTVITIYALTFWTSSIAMVWVGTPLSILSLVGTTALLIFIGYWVWCVAYRKSPSFSPVSMRSGVMQSLLQPVDR